MTRETQRQLYQALKVHTSELEITRGATLGLDLEALDRRIEAAQGLLEWLSQALEPQPPAFPAVQAPPPSRSPADRDQIPPLAPDPPKPPRQ
jgi:hypothetical protein